MVQKDHSFIVLHYQSFLNKYILQVLFTYSLAVGETQHCEAEPHVDAKDDKKHDPSVDRTTVIPVETSMKYLKTVGTYHRSYK
jgi:hypothetical protein